MRPRYNPPARSRTSWLRPFTLNLQAHYLRPYYIIWEKAVKIKLATAGSDSPGAMASSASPCRGKDVPTRTRAYHPTLSPETACSRVPPGRENIVGCHGVVCVAMPGQRHAHAGEGMAPNVFPGDGVLTRPADGTQRGESADGGYRAGHPIASVPLSPVRMR